MAKPTPQKHVPQKDSSSGLVAVVEKRDWEHNGYLLMSKIAIISCIVSILCLAITFYVIKHATKHTYFAATPDGRIIKMIPLNEASLSQAALSNWIARQAVKLYNISYVEYKDQLAKYRTKFTMAGWNSLDNNQSLKPYLDYVIANKAIVTGAVDGAPVLSQIKVINGIIHAEYQVPIIVTYHIGTVKITQHHLMKIFVVRRPQTKHPSGFAIDFIEDQIRNV